MMNSITNFLNTASEYTILTKEEEIELSKRRMAGDESAIDELVLHNIRYAVKLASKFKRDHYVSSTLDELISDSLVGLREAATKYDYNYQTRFSTYATYWINQAMQRGSRNNAHCHLPNYLHEAIQKINKAKNNYYQQYQKEPTLEELASITNLSVAKIQELSVLSLPSVSLETTIGEDLTLEEVLPTYDQYDTLRDDAIHSTVVELFQKANMKPREIEVLCLRHGIHHEQSYTLEEIGQRYHITRERVRQIEKTAEGKIKNYAIEHNLVETILMMLQ